MLTYLTYGYTLRLYESSGKYYVYIYTLMWYMRYLLSVTYVILCTGFVLGLDIIHWACGCSTPRFIPFFQGWTLLVACRLVLCNLIRLYICTLDLSNVGVELCNSFLIVNVILNMKCLYCISFEWLCKAVWADHLIGQCLL